MTLRRAAVAIATACLSLVPAASAVAAPRPVPCTAAGGGKYHCEWYVAGDGRAGGAKVMMNQKVVGYLHQGTNWITCQQRGAMTRNAAGDRNSWYGWTQSDHGGAGWASAGEARGGGLGERGRSARWRRRRPVSRRARLWRRARPGAGVGRRLGSVGGRSRAGSGARVLVAARGPAGAREL